DLALVGNAVGNLRGALRAGKGGRAHRDGQVAGRLGGAGDPVDLFPLDAEFGRDLGDVLAGGETSADLLGLGLEAGIDLVPRPGRDDLVAHVLQFAVVLRRDGGNVVPDEAAFDGDRFILDADVGSERAADQTRGQVLDRLPLVVGAVLVDRGYRDDRDIVFLADLGERLAASAGVLDHVALIGDLCGGALVGELLLDLGLGLVERRNLLRLDLGD